MNQSVVSKTFITKGQDGVSKKWMYSGPKQGGANDAGDYGGVYTSESDVGEIFRSLVKKDHRAHVNIAEFIASRIYQAVIPDASAVIRLVRVDDEIEISQDGTNVYLLSEFIPGWQHDLYTEIQHFFKRHPKHSIYKLLERIEVRSQLVLYPQEVKNLFRAAVSQGNLTNFGQICAVSLLTNNVDINLGNVGVLQVGDQKKLGVVDYGVAFCDITSKIDPNSYKKYFLSHTLRGEGGNNFMFYPEFIKITSEFVAELDKASTIDLTGIINNAFDEITAYFGIRPIFDFAVRAGISEKYSDTMLKKLEQNPALYKAFLIQIKERLMNSIKERQADLSCFSAQIKMDMCVHRDRITNEYNLDGRFYDQDTKEITFPDVVFSHFDYFKRIVLREEKFKFWKSTHKHQSKLVEKVEDKCIEIYACFILAKQNKNVQDKFNIHTMEQAIFALKNGDLNKETLITVFDKSLIQKAREIFEYYEEDKKKKKLELALSIIKGENILITDLINKRLESNQKLQEAIIELHAGCIKMSKTFTHQQQKALLTYKKETITLALQDEKKFKEYYPTIESKAIAVIDNNNFAKFARAVGNLIWVILTNILTVGGFALYYKNNRNGMLLFNSPQQKIETAVSKLYKLKFLEPTNALTNMSPMINEASEKSCPWFNKFVCFIMT